MLTLKNVLPSGFEHLIEVEEVSSGAVTNLDGKTVGMCVNGWRQAGVAYVCTEGTVYVMNSNGRTVADYCLTPPDSNELKARL